VLGRLGEAQARVDDDPVAGHATGERRVDPRTEFRTHLFDHIRVPGQLPHPVGVAAPVHEHPRAARVGHHPHHVGVREAARHVVDDRGPRRERGRRDARPGRVDGHRDTLGGEDLDHGHDPCPLGGRVDTLSTRPGRLAADIDERRTVCAHLNRVGHCRV
jgi:hypothetical protein